MDVGAIVEVLCVFYRCHVIVLVVAVIIVVIAFFFLCQQYRQYQLRVININTSQPDVVVWVVAATVTVVPNSPRLLPPANDERKQTIASTTMR